MKTLVYLALLYGTSTLAGALTIVVLGATPIGWATCVVGLVLGVFWARQRERRNG